MELKNNLHARSVHRQRYDFKQLTAKCPELKKYVFVNKYGDESIDFAKAPAVKALNKALLASFYNITWDIPAGYLCPPIPGRADYIHNIADLLAKSNDGVIPQGPVVQGLDIGVGASCIYPLLGHQIYGWDFIGSDLDKLSIANAQKIITANEVVKDHICCRLQKSSNHIFKTIIHPDEYFDFTICNPPFHASKEEAIADNARKNRNLNIATKGTNLNFGGHVTELWCDGGELSFIKTMIKESLEFSTHCFWFTTLVSKKENLIALYQELKNVMVAETHTLTMGQGHKISRIVAWTFLDKNQQNAWKQKRWNKK
jgi:23S rRNA (adenine1618-N6)-methyltransferase